jgi:glycosyltransferase involved in cell wall biosynthesis
MIKILQILPTDSPGIQQLADSIENSLPNEEFEVITAYLNPTSSQHFSSCTKHFNFDKKETKGLRLKALWEIFKYCRDEQFDIVITHRFKPLYLMLILNKFLNIPKCISVIHGFDDFSRGYRCLTLKLLWSKQWQFIAISGAVANYLERLSTKTGTHQITTINNAIDVTALTQSLKTKQQSRSALGLDPQFTTFGTIGRLIPLKGHIHLIKAFERVLKERPNSHLVIIGEGRCRSEIESYLSSHNLQTNVTLTGHLDNAADYLKGFDIFILPSLKEGFGMVILEAMAAKLPVIASRTGGIPYILGELGHLVSPLDYPQKLASTMLEQANLTDGERRKEGEALYRRLLDQFDEPYYQRKWLELIKK